MISVKNYFPKSIKDFRTSFSWEESCIFYLIQCHWPNGFICNKCHATKHWYRHSRKLLVCQSCRKEVSPISGTVMHRSHIPIQEWFWAAYLVATITPGVSALQLQRQLGLGSYRTAWFMQHRLRRGMVDDNRTALSGTVEADETIIGGPVKNKRGRGVIVEANKSLVVGTVEVITYMDKKGNWKEKAGRLRLTVIDHADENTIGSFLRGNVASGSTVRSDGWRGYSKTALGGYIHDQRVVSSSNKLAHQIAPHIHRVFSNLKTWLQGTHHGVEPKYLSTYLDEFVFRFNRRKNPQSAFKALLGIASHKSPITLRQLKA